MPLLFSYGTLRDPEVQRSLFGRTLAGRKDSLLGYELASIEVADAAFARESGKSTHAILKASSDASTEVEGMVFEVTEAELEQVDRYEPVEYRRVMADLASGKQTWVFVEGRGEDS